MTTTETTPPAVSQADTVCSEIELYVHTFEHEDPRLFKISMNATIEDLLKKVAPGRHHELTLFVEDEEEPKEHHHRLHEHHIRHRHHVHCGPCRSIEVAVLYNGVEHKKPFAPGKTIGKILHWALKKFELNGADAANKTLRLTSHPNEPLPDHAHIGSYAKHPHCCVELSLADIINPNG